MSDSSQSNKLNRIQAKFRKKSKKQKMDTTLCQYRSNNFSDVSIPSFESADSCLISQK